MEGLGGGISHIPRAFPKSHPGKIQGRQEARPKPTSCTGFLEGHDKEEEGATWRGGGCSEEGGQAGWGPNVANLQLLPSPPECICVMLPGAESWRLSRACTSHTPRGYFTTEKPHALLGKPVLCAHNGNLDQGDDTPRSSSQISREETGPA